MPRGAHPGGYKHFGGYRGSGFGRGFYGGGFGRYNYGTYGYGRYRRPYGYYINYPIVYANTYPVAYPYSYYDSYPDVVNVYNIFDDDDDWFVTRPARYFY